MNRRLTLVLCGFLAGGIAAFSCGDDAPDSEGSMILGGAGGDRAGGAGGSSARGRQNPPPGEPGAGGSGGTGGSSAGGAGGSKTGGTAGSSAAGAGGSKTGGTAGMSACLPTDCQGQPVPEIGCANGASPVFGCARGNDGRCRWSGPQCGTTDAAAASTTDGGVGAACGSTICGPGLTCCNASCGLCAPPGGACIQIACEPRPDAASSSAACKVNADCRLFDDYCMGCNCRALSSSEKDPVCNGPVFACFAQPCATKEAVCEGGRCVVREKAPTTGP